MSEEIDIAGKMVNKDLLLEYVLSIADFENQDKRLEIHNKICEAVNEDTDSNWSKEVLCDFMTGFMMRPAIMHYIESNGYNFIDTLNIFLIR